MGKKTIPTVSESRQTARPHHLLMKLRAELGLSCRYISHDLASVECIPDRVLAMSPGAAFARPATPARGRFSIPDPAGKERVEPPGGEVPPPRGGVVPRAAAGRAIRRLLPGSRPPSLTGAAG